LAFLPIHAPKLSNGSRIDPRKNPVDGEVVSNYFPSLHGKVNWGFKGEVTSDTSEALL
jgi:hypothetical protein